MGLIFSGKRAVLCLFVLGLLSGPLFAAGTFTISASPSSLTIGQGNIGTSTITTTISGGFNSSISLSASGLPLGSGASFNPQTISAPGSGTSTMTVNVLRIAKRGTYNFTVVGTGGGVRKTVTITLIITFEGDFTIAAAPSSLTIPQGNQGTSTITTTAFGGFGSPINLSYSGAPSGTTVSFNPQTIPSPGSGTSTMTITVGSNTPAGTYPIVVNGSGGGFNHNVTVTLTVTQQSKPDFSISASPSSLTIAQGNNGNSTITTTISGGFNSSISLSASGAPSGTSVSFNPQTIPAPGSGSSTMTITVGSSTPTGTYPITVTGNGGGTQHNTTVTLTVSNAANFTISASPASLSVTQGNQGNSTITTTITGGFNSSISLSASGAPSGTNIGFNPQSIPAPGSGTSVMTITVGSSTPTGTYPITVAGNGGGIQQTTTVTLTVTAPGSGPNNANFEESYSFQLQSSFGTPPYTYQLTSGSLPPGITMSSSGNLAGKATAVASYPFSVLVTDSSSPQQKQSFNYTLTVVIGLDTYGGLTAAPVPNCTKTGYFQIMKVKGRWIYASPLCNAFFQSSVYDADFQFILPQTLQQRYNNDYTLWATHSLQRMQFYGFNAMDIFYSDYMLPVGTWGRKSGASVQLPFTLYYSALNDVIFHPQNLGIPEPLKDVCLGQDSNGFNGYCSTTLDVFDPKWKTANTGEVQQQIGEYTGGFKSSPWIIGISLGDSANMNLLTGGPDGPHGVGVYAHAGFIIATDNFTYSGNWQDPVLHSKYEWVNYLQNKYHSISALNSAWGTGGFYTAFGDAGGFGSGTGVLDEDGRHTQWFGNDYFKLQGMNSNLQADVNQFLYNFAFQAYGVQASAVKTYDTNHLIICGTFGGSGDGGARPVVLQALRDAGCNIFVWNWNSYYPDSALAANKAEYDAVGVPAVLWNGTSSQADSDYSNYPYPKYGAYEGDYSTQALRGQHYGSDVQAIFNSRGTNGDYYILGTAWWSLTDNTSEKTNWGLVSLSDNAYDGKCAVINQSTDQWGYPCGGEAANYGDFLDPVIQSNSNSLQQLILQLLQ